MQKKVLARRSENTIILTSKVGHNYATIPLLGMTDSGGAEIAPSGKQDGPPTQ